MADTPHRNVNMVNFICDNVCIFAWTLKLKQSKVKLGLELRGLRTLFKGLNLTIHAHPSSIHKIMQIQDSSFS